MAYEFADVQLATDKITQQAIGGEIPWEVRGQYIGEDGRYEVTDDAATARELYKQCVAVHAGEATLNSLCILQYETPINPTYDFLHASRVRLTVTVDPNRRSSMTQFQTAETIHYNLITHNGLYKAPPPCEDCQETDGNNIVDQYTEQLEELRKTRDSNGQPRDLKQELKLYQQCAEHVAAWEQQRVQNHERLADRPRLLNELEPAGVSGQYNFRSKRQDDETFDRSSQVQTPTPHFKNGPHVFLGDTTRLNGLGYAYYRADAFNEHYLKTTLRNLTIPEAFPAVRRSA